MQTFNCYALFHIVFTSPHQRGSKGNLESECPDLITFAFLGTVAVPIPEYK